MTVRLQKNWHLICCVLWAVIFSVALTSAENPTNKLSNEDELSAENLSSAAEIEDSAENSALLRNFFSVNLQKSKHPPHPPPPRQQISSRKLPIVSKHTQKNRLRHLFKALRNPLARK